jgi:putative ABC transport system permease protein
MKVEVNEQVRLSLGKCFELVLSGIRYRLFRASITVIIIALAVAFLMTMLSESLVARRVAGAIDSQTGPRKQLLFWVNRLSLPLTQQEIIDQLAVGAAGDRVREFEAWGGFAPDSPEMRQLADLAAAQRAYSKYFTDLPAGARNRMVGNAAGVEIFDRLCNERAMGQFETQYSQSDRKLPDACTVEGLKDMLRQWEATRPLRQRIIDGHQRAMEQFRRWAGERPTMELIAAADESLPEKLAPLGYRMDKSEVGAIRRQAQLTLDQAWMSSLVKVTLIKSRLRDKVGAKDVASVDAGALYSFAAGESGARWISEQLASGDVQKQAQAQGIALTQMPVDRMREVADDYIRNQKTAQVEQAVSQATVADGFMGFSKRTLWLIAVSFMVCVVGIANAMLMSVTERFREIATMKCLGATDGFIMINFILESVMQGIAGGVIGAMLGLLLGLVRSWGNYGFMALSHFPLLEVLSVGGAALLTGVIISALAAVYPAWVAARLAPMEAMRIE